MYETKTKLSNKTTNLFLYILKLLKIILLLNQIEKVFDLHLWKILTKSSHHRTTVFRELGC